MGLDDVRKAMFVCLHFCMTIEIRVPHNGIEVIAAAAVMMKIKTSR
jgi:hypothetical protein